MGIRGGSEYQPVYQFTAQAMAATESNGAPLTRVSSIDIPARLFDDTTSEKILGCFRLPDNCKSGILTCTAVVEAVTAANANVAYSLGYKTVAHGSIMSAPWLSQPFSKTFALDDTANKVHVHEMTFDVSVGVAGNLVFFHFGRTPAAENNLSGDLRLYHLSIKVPV